MENEYQGPVFKNRHNEKYDTKDGVKWDSRACAVVAHVWCQVIHTNDMITNYVLVGKRGTGGDNPGLLNLPCGYIDWDETLAEAAAREVWEETGLDLNLYADKISVMALDEPWYVNTNPSENRQNISLHTALVITLNENDKLPELSLDNMEEDESEGAYWFPIHDILESDPELWAFKHKDRIIHFMNYLVAFLDENIPEDASEQPAAE